MPEQSFSGTCFGVRHSHAICVNFTQRSGGNFATFFEKGRGNGSARVVLDYTMVKS